ncbi:MAG TPA: hypothetical protein VMY35_04750 [Phycisphaerae bacterium]|nr:hypothetical protein [Phycisphaerae bacterium]
MTDRRYHEVARCCWCGGRFWWAADSYWLCETEACQTRQMDYAVWVKGARGTQRYLYVPTPKQVDFESCPARNLLGGGAAGASKSHGARWGQYRRALAVPGFEGLILRRTFPELEKTHLRRMAQDAPLLGAEYVDSKRLMRFPNGSLIEAGHCDDKDAVQKYLSTEYDQIDIDEASTFEGDWLIELATRARSNKPGILASGGAKFRCWSNPGGIGSLFLMDFFIDQSPDPERYRYYAPDEWTFIPGRVDDNPYLDPSYARTLEQLPEARRRQLRDGDWRVFEGQFFSAWDEHTHVADLGVVSPDLRWFGSLDWGYNAPGVCYWWVCLPDGHYYLAQEYKFNGATGQKVTVKEVAEEIHRVSRMLGLDQTPVIYADPATKQRTGQVGESILETFQRYGVPMQVSNNDRVNGWQRVHELLRLAPDGRPWLLVSPQCTYLIRTLPAAVQDDKNPDDLDTAGDDHALDALRYGAMSWPSASHRVKPRLIVPGSLADFRRERRAQYVLSR